MQKLFFVGFLLISFVASAQTTKPFKVNVAGGYAAPTDKVDNKEVGKSGFVYSVEPQYELSKNLEVGIRLEQAFIKRPEVLDNVIFYTTKANSMLSAVATANYVISVGPALRPYLGVGGGLYYVDKSEQTYQSGSSTVYYPLPATTAFGGLGRVGIKFKRLNVEANYNLIGETSVTNGATRQTLTAKNSYFSVKAGLTIGGSR